MRTVAVKCHFREHGFERCVGMSLLAHQAKAVKECCGGAYDLCPFIQITALARGRSVEREKSRLKEAENDVGKHLGGK